MKKSENIIELIKSLSQSEKRYFKLFAGHNKSNSHYLKLFDLFEKTGTANEQVIRKKYKNEKLSQQQFWVYKHRLYTLILKSLGAFHAGKSIDSELRELIEQAEVLYNKSLYSAAKKALIKAKKLACKHEMFILLLEVIRWEKKIAKSLYYDSYNNEDINHIYEEEIRIATITKNTNVYWKLFSNMFKLYSLKGFPKSRQEIDIYDALINNPLFKTEELALSFEAKRLFYHTHTLFCMVTEKLTEAYYYSKKLIGLLEAYPEKIEMDTEAYSSALYNSMFFARDLKEYEGFFNTLYKIKNFILNRSSEMDKSKRLYSLWFFYSAASAGYIDTGQFKKGMLLIPGIEKIIKNQKLENSIKLILLFNICVIYHGVGEYKKALSYINLILNDDKHFSSEMLIYKIFRFILHYELGNIDLFPYLFKPVYNELLKKEKPYKTEELLIDFIKVKIKKIKNKTQERRAFKTLRNKLVEICIDPFEAKLLRNNFDYISWLESKIENRPLEDILREKSGYVPKESEG